MHPACILGESHKEESGKRGNYGMENDRRGVRKTEEKEEERGAVRRDEA